MAAAMWAPVRAARGARIRNLPAPCKSISRRARAGDRAAPCRAKIWQIKFTATARSRSLGTLGLVVRRVANASREYSCLSEGPAARESSWLSVVSGKGLTQSAGWAAVRCARLLGGGGAGGGVTAASSRALAGSSSARSPTSLGCPCVGWRGLRERRRDLLVRKAFGRPSLFPLKGRIRNINGISISF